MEYLVIVITAIIFIMLFPHILGALFLFYKFVTKSVHLVTSYKKRCIVLVDKVIGINLFKWIKGITLGFFIFIEDQKIGKKIIYEDKWGKEEIIDGYRIIINHEICHTKQELIYGMLFFPIYCVNYLINLAKYRDDTTAYRNIKFEIEAVKYSLQEEVNYLKREILRIASDLAIPVEERKAKIRDISSAIKNLKND